MKKLQSDEQIILIITKALTFYVHSSIEKNIGKIISVVKLDGITKNKNEGIGVKIAMHVAASILCRSIKRKLIKKLLIKN